MKGLLTIGMLLLGVVAIAQETNTSLSNSSTTDKQKPMTTEPMGLTADVSQPVAIDTAEDSLHLPTLNQW